MNISNQTIEKKSSSVNKKIEKQSGTKETLSLNPFLEYLAEKDGLENSIPFTTFSKARKQFEQFFKRFTLTTPNDQENNSDTFEFIEQILDLGYDHQHCSFNLFTMPGTSQIVHLKRVPKGFLSAAVSSDLIVKKLRSFLDGNPRELLLHLYKRIWDHYIPLGFPQLPPLIIPIDDELREKKYFFQLMIDQRFISVESLLPSENIVNILTGIDLVANTNDERYILLEKQLPLENFRFSGFKRIQVSDVTTDQIIKNIADQILKADYKSADSAYINEIIEALDITAESGDLEFGLFPMIKINDEFTFKDPRRNQDLMAGSYVDMDTKELLYDFLANIYRNQPRVIYLPFITDEFAGEYQYLEILRKGGIQSFALIPVFYQQSFIGVLEVMTKKTGALTRATLTKLDSFFPVLALHFKKSVDRFDQLLTDIIKEKFTSLQPSVQWRFNVAAWNHLQNRHLQTAKDEEERIAFEQVYPLYGAVDIKNSTVNRNIALRNDMSSQLGLLAILLVELKNKTGFELLDEKIFLCDQWLQRVLDPAFILLEEEINYFIENDSHPFLKELALAKPNTALLVEEYNKLLIEGNGIINIHRQKVESAMNMVINCVNDEIEKIQLQAQANFPCFFDKFRTDGVEYDIYIGQSIAPGKPFKPMYIQNLRLLQLKNMISIVRKVHTLQPLLPVPIDVTQLIFVQPHVIDITFRTDERRFDVEGAYNIRYHIVKKRIDKVLIKGTQERLTAPGKIAIVYFNVKELEEFMVHINFLQREKLLTANTEYLELEPLQGVVGLKAIRVEIVLFNNL